MKRPPRYKILQSWMPQHHAAKFREIMARKGTTVSAELYRYVLQVLKRESRKKGASAFDPRPSK